MVRSTQFNDRVVFKNELGEFEIPIRPGPLGVGYITRWTRPNGQAMTQARVIGSGTSSRAGYLNDPGEGVGIGAFGMYLAFGPHPWRYWDTAWGAAPPSTSWCVGSRRVGWPGIAWVSPAEISNTVYEQGLALNDGQVIVRVRWTFTPRTVKLQGSLRFAPDPAKPFWVKEPEFGFSLNGVGTRIHTIVTPDTKCNPYTGLVDPAKRTGRCEDPDRRFVLLKGHSACKLTVDDKDWRKIADEMKTWTRAGNDPCPGFTKLRIHDNWEYVARAKSADAAYDNLVCLFKGQEGCVSGLDFNYGFRQPKPTRAFHITMKFTRI